MRRDETKLNRRKFLLALGGGAASAAAVVGTAVPQASPEESRNDKRATKGYQLSEHIRNYYRTTKV